MPWKPLSHCGRPRPARKFVTNASMSGETRVESDVRDYRRRANDEIVAANRAVTQAARERRMQLAGIFLDRLRELEDRSAFEWAE